MADVPASTALVRVLTIAGSDPSGGAGIQADIKTITALGGYAMAAITALTAQNTQGVKGVYPVPADFVAQQVQLCLEDIGVDAVKTGMLYDADIIAAIAVLLKQYPVTLVLDPVMIAKGGAPLLQKQAVHALKAHLLPQAFLVTPNIPEAVALTGIAIYNQTDAEKAAKVLLAMGAKNVLIKGGHGAGETLVDVLVTADGVQAFPVPRIDSRHTHGTGCTLASAIATRLAQGKAMSQAVQQAQAYVQRAILQAPGFGKGHGPLNHLHGM